jgi:hypothetical protein
MLRFFQMVSDVIVYAANVATVIFPRNTDNPAAIIGIDARATNRQLILQNQVHFIRVAGRQYTTGDPFSLGLLTPTQPGGAATLSPSGKPYFPGSAIALPGGGSCGAILMAPEEGVQVKIEDVTAGSAILTQLVLHCVEFTEDCENAEALRDQYNRLRKGLGETYFTGHKQVYTVAGKHSLQGQPMPPNARALRRLQVRGLALTTATMAVAEADFLLVKAHLYTNTERAPHNQAVPARAVIGHGALDIPGAGMVDLSGEEGRDRAIVDLTVPAPAGSTTAHIVQIFEGRDHNEERLGSATAVS